MWFGVLLVFFLKISNTTILVLSIKQTTLQVSEVSLILNPKHPVAQQMAWVLPLAWGLICLPAEAEDNALF